MTLKLNKNVGFLNRPEHSEMSVTKQAYLQCNPIIPSKLSTLSNPHTVDSVQFLYIVPAVNSRQTRFPAAITFSNQISNLGKFRSIQ